MIAYGFFLPTKDAIKIRAKKLNLSIADYLLKDKEFNVEEFKMDYFRKNPIEYWESQNHDFKLAEFPRGIESWIDSNQSGESLVFIGMTALVYNIGPLDEFIGKIKFKQTESLVEEMGFSGYVFHNYLMPKNRMDFYTLREQDIQILSMEKLL